LFWRIGGLTLLKISHLNFKYPNSTAINDLTMQVKEKEIVSLIGKRASGKSTLFKIIAGLQEPDSGNIFFIGENITQNRPKSLNGKMVCLNRYYGLFNEMSVKDNIELGAWNIKDKKIFQENLNKTLELIPHLHKQYNKNIKFLCNGEKMLTAIARAIISFPKLIVIDEPTLGFYPLFAEKILDLIHKANQLGITFLLMQNKLENAVKISNWIYEIEDGEIIKEGDNKSFEKFDLQRY
jgi:ABC-type branched-chain amino acid transport systems, ATPase component